MIIGLNGVARAGKDSVAQVLVEEWGFTQFSFADPMRESLLALDPIVKDSAHGFVRVSDLVAYSGWDNAKTHYPEVRQLLQRYGTEAHRDIFGEDFWVERTAKLVAGVERVVISDVRFPNEGRWIRSTGGRVWCIQRPGYEPVNSHISDNTRVLYDYRLLNTGSLDDLAEKVAVLMREHLVTRQ